MAFLKDKKRGRSYEEWKRWLRKNDVRRYHEEIGYEWESDAVPVERDDYKYKGRKKNGKEMWTVKAFVRDNCRYRSYAEQMERRNRGEVIYLGWRYDVYVGGDFLFGCDQLNAVCAELRHLGLYNGEFGEFEEMLEYTGEKDSRGRRMLDWGYYSVGGTVVRIKERETVYDKVEYEKDMLRLRNGWKERIRLLRRRTEDRQKYPKKKKRPTR